MIQVRENAFAIGPLSQAPDILAEIPGGSSFFQPFDTNLPYIQLASPILDNRKDSANFFRNRFFLSKKSLDAVIVAVC